MVVCLAPSVPLWHRIGQHDIVAHEYRLDNVCKSRPRQSPALNFLSPRVCRDLWDVSARRELAN